LWRSSRSSVKRFRYFFEITVERFFNGGPMRCTRGIGILCSDANQQLWGAQLPQPE
jgi:hypothetical protein